MVSVPCVELPRPCFDVNDPSVRPYVPRIVGLIVGGSTLFTGIVPSRDLDCLVLLRHREDVRTLASDLPALEVLCQLTLSIEHWSAIPDALSQGLEFDCVRLAGTSSDGEKKSVKLVSLECLSERERSTILILTTKNNRAYVTARGSQQSWCLFSATSFAMSDGVPYFLLHDYDIATQPRFGLTCDLLTTGGLVQKDGSVIPILHPINRHTEVYTLVHDLVAKMLRIHAEKLPVEPMKLWQRWPRYTDGFRHTLTSWLNEVHMYSSGSKNRAMADNSVVLSCPDVLSLYAAPSAASPLHVTQLSSVGSRRELHVEVTIVASAGTKAAVKAEYVSHECYVHRDVFADPPQPRSRFPDGTPAFQVHRARLEEITSWFFSPPQLHCPHAAENAKLVLNSSLWQAEAMLRDALAPQVHYPRLWQPVEPLDSRFAAIGVDEQLRGLHPRGIQTADERLEVSTVLRLRLVINSVATSTLGQLLEEAQGRVIRLDMCRYEAQLQSTWMQLARRMYSGCFAPYYYADRLELDLRRIGAIKVVREGDDLHIEFNPLSRFSDHNDRVGRALMEIVVGLVAKPLLSLRPQAAQGESISRRANGQATYRCWLPHCYAPPSSSETSRKAVMSFGRTSPLPSY